MGGFYLLQWFWRLRNRNKSGFNGPDPVSWEALDAWVRLSGDNPEPWEINVLEALDDAYVAAVDRAQSKTFSKPE